MLSILRDHRLVGDTRQKDVFLLPNLLFVANSESRGNSLPNEACPQGEMDVDLSSWVGRIGCGYRRTLGRAARSSRVRARVRHTCGSSSDHSVSFPSSAQFDWRLFR